MLAIAAPAAVASFGPPVDLSAPGGNADTPQVSAGLDGVTTVVWGRSDGTHRLIQAATRAAGGSSFSAAVTLSAPGQAAFGEQVAFGPDGAATAVWRRSNGTNDVVQTAMQAPGATDFGSPVDISTPGVDSYEPQIAIAPDGVATVAWYRWDGTSATVQAATRPAGAAVFGAPEDISVAGGSAYLQQIAVGPDGAVTVVWRRSNGTNSIVQAATRPAGATSFGAPVDLSAPGQDATRPEVAVGPGGLTAVVWQRSDGSNTIIQAATRAAGSTTFSAPQDLSAPGQSAEVPQVAIGSDGAMTAVWRRFDAGPTQSIIQVATRPAGATSFGAPQDLSPAGQFGFDPQVAVAPDGAPTAVWSLNGASYIIQAATRATGSTTFAPAVDLSPGGQLSSKPAIAIGPDGAGTVAWFANGGSGPHIIQASVSPATHARISVSREGTGSGSVTSTPAGITCGSTCTSYFPLGSSVTLAATPAAGSSFAGWGGACSGTATSCAVTVSQAATVRGTFVAASAATTALRATLGASRRVVVRGQTVRLRIRTTNAGALSASSVRACLGIPRGLALVRAGGGVRSGRSVCFAVGEMAAGATRTKEATVRAVSARPAVRRVTGSARSVSAAPEGVVAAPLAIRIRLTPAWAAVTG